MTEFRNGDCFTGRGSMICLSADDFSSTGRFRRLRFGRPQCGETDDPRGFDLFGLSLKENGEATEMTAVCEPGILRITGDGEQPRAAICFPEPNLIRIRGTGCHLFFSARLNEHEAAVDRLDGTFQLGFFDSMGEVLFYPILGEGKLYSQWDWTRAGTPSLLLEFFPDAEGVFDVCLRYGAANMEKVSDLPEFDACVTGTGDGKAEWHSPAILGTGMPFDLRSVQFSRRGSFLCILEDDADRSLYLSLSRSPKMWMQRKNLVRIQPERMPDEEGNPYTVEAGRLAVRSGNGRAEFCLDAEGAMHVRVTGTSISFSWEERFGEYTARINDQCCETAFSEIGRLKYTVRQGNLRMDGSPEAPEHLITLSPDADTEIGEMIIDQTATDFLSHACGNLSFDDIVRDAEEDFTKFAGRYFPDLRSTSLFSLTAGWTVWTHTLGPAGNLKHAVVYMTRTQWLRAFGWQQSFHSMAVSNDAEAAWDLILTMFDYQDPAGQLPDSVGDIGAAYLVTKPALQGLALDSWLKRYRMQDISAEKRRKLYRGFSRFAEWWLVRRDRNHSGVPQYFHADESPGEFCSCFREGVPLYSPDLIAFVTLLTEGCAKLASSLDRPDESAAWQERSETLLQRLIQDFWDGEKFIYRLAATGKEVKSGAFLSLLPVMLGRRLPEDILKSLVIRLMDEKEYLLPDGIAVENIREAGTLAKTPGPTGAPVYVGTLICVGLMNAGYPEAAAEIARRVCAGMERTGFTFMHFTEEASEGRTKTVPKWTSWSAGCYLLLRESLKGFHA